MLRNLFKNNQVFIKHGLFSSLIIILNILISIIVIRQLLQILTVNTYGVWIITFNIITILSMLHFGFTAISIFKFQDYFQAKTLKVFFSRNLYVVLIQFAFIILTFIIIQSNLKYLIQNKDELILAKKMLLIAFPGLLLNSLSNYIESVLYYNLKFIFYRNLLEFFRLGIFNIIAFIGVYLSGNSLFLPITYSFVAFITFLMSVYKIKSKISIEFDLKEIKSDYLKNNYKNAFSFWILGFSSFVITQTDVFFISYIKKDLSLVTLYAQSFRLQDVILKFIKKITEIKGPIILSLYQSGNHIKVYKIYIKLLKINLILSICAFVFIAFTGKIILEYWLDYKIIFDQTLITILGLICISSSVHWVFWNFCNITEQQNKIKVFSIIEIFTNLILSYILLNKIGLIGLGIASLISNSITIFYMYKLFLNYKKNHLTETTHV